jgi:hypothetical protein
MKGTSILRGGILGGMAAALALAAVGQWLGFALPPWDWRSTFTGRAASAAEWARTAAVLLPFALVLGTIGAAICAVVFEYLLGRAGWLRGLLIGIWLGTALAAVVGLMPWAASWYGYAYTPIAPPLGTHDPAWAFVALTGAAGLLGAIAGLAYGEPRHARARQRRIRWRQIYPPPGGDWRQTCTADPSETIPSR